MHEGDCVRQTRAEEDFVFRMNKPILKSQIITHLLFGNTILIGLFFTKIHDFGASRLPILLRFNAANIWFHSSLKERKLLLESINIEFNNARQQVLHRKVKPLAMTIGVGVHTHVEIKLAFSYPDYDARVPERP